MAPGRPAARARTTVPATPDPRLKPADPLLTHVGASVARLQLIPPGSRVLVGVSGGSDSVVLLHLLHRLRRAPGPPPAFTLLAAHFNHRLRGRASDADARFVQRLCNQLDVPFVLGAAPALQQTKTPGASMEMTARELRHRFLAHEARRLRCVVVALGHNANDQAELVLLRLLRGTSPAGLGAMDWAAPSPANPSLQIVRPLLDCTRADIEQFAVRHRLRWREDASNRDVGIPRNRVRHKLLPLLRRQYQPAIDQVLVRLAELARHESRLIEDLAGEWLADRSPAKRPFDALPVALQRRAVVLSLQRLGIAPDFETVEKLRAHPDSPHTLAGAQSVIRNAAGEVLLQHIDSAPSPNPARLRFHGSRGRLFWAGRQIDWQINALSRPVRHPVRPPDGEQWFDAGKVGPELVLRTWQPGDRYQPLGMPTPVKLQDCFVNRKIPRPERARRLVLATPERSIVWVEGLPPSECFKLDRNTARRLKWRIYGAAKALPVAGDDSP